MSEPVGPSAPPLRGDLAWLAQHAWLAVGALAFVQLAMVATPVLYFHGGDNAHYLELARALAAGEGYRDLHLDPAGPHTKYPPGFPLLLAAVFTVAGEDLTVAKAVVAGLAGVMVAATALLWRTRGEDGTALAAAVWVATVPLHLTLAMRLLSELPFAAFVTLALLGCERALAARRSPEVVAGAWRGGGWLALASGCAVAAGMTRAAGLVLVPALAGAALLAGRPGGGDARAPSPRRGGVLEALVLVAPAAAVGVAWLAWVRGHAAGASRAYLGEFWLAERTLAGGDTVGLADLAGRVVHGVGYYVDALGRSLLPAAGEGGAVVVGASVLTFAAVGFARSVRARWGGPELFVIAYGALVLVWPAREERFLVALLPILLYHALLGLRTVVGLAGRPPVPAAAMWSATAAIALVGTVANLATIEAARRDRFAPGLVLGPGLRVVAVHEGAARMLALAAHLREHAEPDARILARKPRLVAVVAERVTVGPPFPPAPEALVAHLEAHAIDYVVVDELYRETARILVPAVAASPDRFSEVARVGESGSRVWRFHPSRRVEPMDPGAPLPGAGSRVR